MKHDFKTMTRICDYEGSQYRTEFWENQNRQYEDLVERIALEHMLPPTGNRLIEVGAGFGRLVTMYDGYEQIILTDYARTQLEEAQRYLGQDDRFTFVVANVYDLPFVDHLFDTLVMIRLMHHLVDVPMALGELARITNPVGTTIIEHASKLHLKSILRWYLGQQIWNPFDLDPYEFVELNIDFHPKWMRQQFVEAKLQIQQIRTVSYFRVPLFKKIFSPQFLATLDGLTQSTGRWWQLAPSIFLQATPEKPLVYTIDGFFRCPACHQTQFEEEINFLVCLNCQKRWSCQDGIYDFKTPLADS